MAENLPNYNWYFFRDTIAKNEREQLVRQLEIQLKHIKNQGNEFLLNELRVNNSKNKKTQNVQPSFMENLLINLDLKTEIVYPSQINSFHNYNIVLKKTMGNFEYIKNLMRIFIGQDNFLLFIEQIRIEEFFPSINNTISQFLDKLFNDISLNLRKLAISVNLNGKYDEPNKNDYLYFEGKHNCFLNCRNCCDFIIHTKSPLLGGQYCKAHTHVGRFCTYQLMGIDLPPEKHVCKEYYCGNLFTPEWLGVIDSKHHSLDESEKRDNEMGLRHGCKLEEFTPLYTMSEREEFFSLMYKINNFKGQSPNSQLNITQIDQIMNIQKRSKEIDSYFQAIAFFRENTQIFKHEFPKDFENLWFSIKENDIKNIKKHISNICEYLDEKNHKLLKKNLSLFLKKYLIWWNIFRKRRKMIEEKESTS